MNITTDAPDNNFEPVGGQEISFPYKHFEGLQVLRQKMLVQSKDYVPKLKEPHPNDSGFLLCDHGTMQTLGGDLYVIPCTFAKIDGEYRN